MNTITRLARPNPASAPVTCRSLLVVPFPKFDWTPSIRQGTQATTANAIPSQSSETTGFPIAIDRIMAIEIAKHLQQIGRYLGPVPHFLLHSGLSICVLHRFVGPCQPISALYRSCPDTPFAPAGFAMPKTNRKGRRKLGLMRRHLSHRRQARFLPKLRGGSISCLLRKEFLM